MSNITKQIEISDFLVNIKPLLKQRNKPIRILKEVKLDLLGFYFKFYEILEEVGLYDNIDLIDTKPDDFDLYEEVVNRFFNDHFVRAGDLNISDLKTNLMNYGDHSSHLTDRINKHSLTSDDGTELNVFSYGNENNNPILIVLPTGMPMLIMKFWIEILSNEYFVVTWETRGMFNLPVDNKELDFNIEAQLVDLEHVVEFFNLDKVHLFGVCHGSNLALHACHKLKEKITSVSFWHGDFNWNDDDKLTYIQQNMKRMLETANDQDDIPVLRSFMCNPKSISRLSTDYPIKMLPHILYPYITDQVFSNFVKLSKDVLYRDLNEIVNKVDQKVLVVTSSKDNTAHPAGSIELHSQLKNSEFHDRHEGSHISFFDAPKDLYEVFSNFY